MNGRKYGQEPYRLILPHGGPGAPGSLAAFAEELSSDRGVLEPFQSADTVDGQIDELREYLIDHAQQPVILIGHSWGAWLSFLLSARYPEMVLKLILVSAGPFDVKYENSVLQTRLNRFSSKERASYDRIMDQWDHSNEYQKQLLFRKLGKLISQADSFERIRSKDPTIEYQPEIFRKIWNEASFLRKSGDLLASGDRIRCPVVAIHGDYDPHPWQGVKKPLEKILANFTFYLLNNCGHEPWLEKYAKGEFFRVLRAECCI